MQSVNNYDKWERLILQPIWRQNVVQSRSESDERSCILLPSLGTLQEQHLLLIWKKQPLKSSLKKTNIVTEQMKSSLLSKEIRCICQRLFLATSERSLEPAQIRRVYFPKHLYSSYMLVTTHSLDLGPL